VKKGVLQRVIPGGGGGDTAEGKFGEEEDSKKKKFGRNVCDQKLQRWGGSEEKRSKKGGLLG